MLRDPHGIAGSEPNEAPDPDPRDDPMAPPNAPCECYCLHCRRIFMSDQIWFQRVKGARDGFKGFWMCPTPNCEGAGFTFDIFPTDPDHPANEGWEEFDDEEDPDAQWIEDEEDEGDEEWDPDEEAYKAMDEVDDGEDDLEGEEWKYGLEPGETPQVEPPPPGVPPRNFAEQEALYNAPDRRPRELDWSDRDLPSLGEDDIPF